MMRLENKVALISGGARGIGAAAAKLFALEGAKVVVGDVLEEEGRRTESEINETGGECLFIGLDVTSEGDWERAVAEAVTKFGKLDILVNNAGIIGEPSVEDTTIELWDRVMDVNAKGVFLGTKTVIPQMRNSGGGSIINISSVGGLVGHVESASYQSSKGAVRIFTKATAIQYARESIRANSIYPGPIATPMTETSRAEPEQNQLMLDGTPLGRWGRPEEVAYGVLYLAADESSFVTGSELVIDGGYTAQ